ncbi:MAG: 6-bladed beta-propeller [Gemmatimonadota bacterium]|nr:6-bladed beta-propeller [Gemmatimonadota bacterium]
MKRPLPKPQVTVVGVLLVGSAACESGEVAQAAPLYPDCSIAFEETWRLGVLDGPEELQFAQVVSFDVSERGAVYVLDGVEAAVSVFRSTAEWTRDFGRAGPGPGELSTPTRIAVAGPRVFVFEAGRNAITAFDTAGTYLRTEPIPFQPAGPTFLAADSEHVYLTGRDPTGDVDGPLVWILDHELTLLRSFGRFSVSDDSLEATRFAGARIAPGRDGVWLTPLLAYDVRLFSLDGEERLQIKRGEDFPFLETEITRQEGGRTGLSLQRAMMLGVFEHPGGTIWVSVQDNVDDRRVLDVFSAGSTWLASVEAAGRTLPWQVARDGHAYRLTDENGYPQVIRYGMRTTGECAAEIELALSAP